MICILGTVETKAFLVFPFLFLPSHLCAQTRAFVLKQHRTRALLSPFLISFLPRRDAMADVSVPASSAPKHKKVVLICLGGKSSVEVNERLFAWSNCNLVDEADDVHIMHFTRTKKTGMSALRAASSQREGVTVIDIAALANADKDEPSKKSKDTVRPVVPSEWLPQTVIDAANKHRAASPSSAVTIFEVTCDAGFNSAEDCITALTRGEFTDPPVALHEALVVPTPDVVCVGSRGQKLLKRLVLGSVSSATLAGSTVPVCVFRSDLPPPSDEQVQTRVKLSDADQGPRAVCIALSGSDASHSVIRWSLDTLLRPSDKIVLLHCDTRKKHTRRGLSEEHVDANLKACEHTVCEWMRKRRETATDGTTANSDAVISMRLEESNGVAYDVRDRMVDFLQKTDVQLLVIGRSNRQGGFSTWSLGTVPMYAVTHGPCPVLVVNAPRVSDA